MEAFKKYGVANIKDLRVEMMLEYVHSELVPKLMLMLMLMREGPLFDDNGDEERVVVGVQAEQQIASTTTKEAFLQAFRLPNLGITTITRWMHACGFRKKSARSVILWMVTNDQKQLHTERPAVFTRQYLNDEVRAHRWIQITLVESQELELNGSIALNCGCNYNDDDVDMVEYHIDTSYVFKERLHLLPFGGNLSVRKPVDTKTVIYFGQDEAIIKQFLFLTKMWVGPHRERPLLPEDEGSGTMISAFICREYGLIRDVPPEILLEANARRMGQRYADLEAATEILGSADKRPLTQDKSPFLVLFEYDENREGYWAYNNMVLQFEVAVDVPLQVLHPSYDFIFMFDHSAGHSKRRPDGLNQH